MMHTHCIIVVIAIRIHKQSTCFLSGIVGLSPGQHYNCGLELLCRGDNGGGGGDFGSDLVLLHSGCSHWISFLDCSSRCYLKRSSFYSGVSLLFLFLLLLLSLLLWDCKKDDVAYELTSPYSWYGVFGDGCHHQQGPWILIASWCEGKEEEEEEEIDNLFHYPHFSSWLCSSFRARAQWCQSCDLSLASSCACSHQDKGSLWTQTG